MRRYGPLIVVAEALAVGDPGRNHLRLTREAVIIREGIENRGIVAWTDVEAIALDVPTTKFRLPGLVSTLLLGALTAAMLSDPGVDPDDGSVTLTIGGELRTVPLSRHHVGGYWAPTLVGAHRLIAHLIAHPEQRALLAHPEPLIDVAAQLARGTR
ncbi:MULTISPECIES: hypothetical protein [unclassified Microbacterium]|uniref:hypothetical protein n=1 Tax=unclassified Microbacterium TaxID=2609290 RepID=UPI000CFE3217|nr:MULTISPECIES: hypothetical protein [unclassified Microbacterium]PQZ61129.1 hypothetical protein CQ032_01135 [Microbacterium sp. MYb43]PQZ82340.1 hypothetical protein CQ031_02755 [Microbacterium sp. MYb40]PRB23960.1 hypothetical protein CQ040_01470 [Microbacterium sp. MYb54]PRB30791.1 hypothetical protein CQ037_04725 [Microbacterium sp. MYb50]PRB70787.1 hypothetical protein CQ021_01135 [Microbacterium sp. MYb24]